MAIFRTAEAFRKNAEVIFKDYGLTFSQYNVLRVLDACEKGRDTITNVGRLLLVTGSNMTGLAKRLESNGYLVRKSHPGDKRLKILEITSEGRKALKGISSEKDRINRYLKGFTHAEKKSMLSQIRLMRSAILQDVLDRAVDE